MAPVTVTELAAPVPVAVAPPLLEIHVAVYFGAVSALPLSAPATNATLSGPVAEVVDPGMAEVTVGAAGEPMITAGDAAEATPLPALFVDLILQV